VTNVIAGPGVAGKNCPYCQTPIKPGARAIVCDACGIPHHIECWQHNGGCTTFGCSGTRAPQGYGHPPVVAPPQQQPYGYQQQPVSFQHVQPNMQHGYAPPPYQYPTDVPPEIVGKLNWGAFLLTLFWSIAHNVWIGLLVLIPYVGWIMPFVLLFKGNEMAWKSRRFESVQHFMLVQSIWTKWGVGLTVTCLGLWILLIIFMAALATGPGY